MNLPSLSIVVPAFNASPTIGRTLRSIFDARDGWKGRLEVIVVDDGSEDAAKLREEVKPYREAVLLGHDQNLGMCASRNSGIANSRGDVVIILDADDQLVPGWPAVFSELLHEWPEDFELCYAACRNLDGRVTASEPDYSGPLTFDDILNERHSGEYLPLFRGTYVRRRPYIDLQMRKSCGIVSYLTFAQQHSLWISKRILRIYDDRRQGSVSSNWTDRAKADQSARCYAELFRRFGDEYRRAAPRVYRTKMLRYAVYLRLAGRPGAWRAWRTGLHVRTAFEALATLALLFAGRRVTAAIVSVAKKIGLIRKYG